jgi:hypothetical protein
VTESVAWCTQRVFYAYCLLVRQCCHPHVLFFFFFVVELIIIVFQDSRQVQRHDVEKSRVLLRLDKR